MFDKLTGRQVFSPDKGNGDGDPPDADKKDNKKKTDDGGDDAARQKELDKQFAERAQRAAETQKKSLYESLGVKDDAEFEAYLKTKQEADDKQKSETQKLADAAKKAQSDLERTKAEKDRELADLQRRVLDTEIKIAAAQTVTDKDGKVTRAAFRKEALADILLLVDRSKIEDKDGEFIGIDKVLADLAKAKPYLLADDQPTDRSKGTPRGPGNKQNRQSDQADQDWFKSI